MMALLLLGLHSFQIYRNQNLLSNLKTISIREITDERPTYGYRRVTALLKKKSQENVNHKRVYRVMRQAGLLLKKPIDQLKRMTAR
jgi:transposase